MRIALFFIVFAISFSASAQDIDRVLVNGKIKAPVGEDVEGVNIYNISSQKGTITDINGDFELEVAANDRVQITALQFQSFTIIVDEGVVDSRRMSIYLNPSVTQLDEVIVRPYDLSGNIIADVARIKTSDVLPPWDLSYETLEFGYEFAPDQYTSYQGNAAEEALNNEGVTNGANIGALIGLLFKKKRSSRQVAVTKEAITNALRQRFPNSYITETFGIPSEYVNDFIYFAEESGIEPRWLRSENEIILLDFLHVQSEKYKAQIEGR